LPAQKPLRIFFSAGEPSGDLHGASLIRQLQARCEGFEAVGYGGPHMAAAGCQLHADMTSLAVMWFTRALVHLHKFWDLVVQAGKYFRHHRPDAVVLIDYPGLNWWIARRAKAVGIPVFYYAPPQVWAWAQWRVRKMRRLVDHVLCCLPFEERWFRQRGCNTTLVGHPFFDDVSQRKLDETFVARLRQEHGPLVTILPGSRTQEVTGNLPWLLKAAAHVQAAAPGVRFAVAAYKPHQAEFARQQAAGLKSPDGRGLSIEVFVGKTPELIEAADCCMAVSGSVSLELLDRTKPSVILYWVSRPAYFVQGLLRKVEYITLVNLLAADQCAADDPMSPPPGRGHVTDRSRAQRALFPEYLTCEDKSAEIAQHVIGWLTDPASRAAVVARLAQLKAQVGRPGSPARAADYIVNHLR
jgi:lipid-A-disaccharide synthase